MWLVNTDLYKGKPMNPDANRRAMAYFATIGVSEDEMQMNGPPQTKDTPEKGEQVEHGVR